MPQHVRATTCKTTHYADHRDDNDYFDNYPCHCHVDLYAMFAHIPKVSASLAGFLLRPVSRMDGTSGNIMAYVAVNFVLLAAALLAEQLGY